MLLDTQKSGATCFFRVLLNELMPLFCSFGQLGVGDDSGTVLYCLGS